MPYPKTTPAFPNSRRTQSYLPIKEDISTNHGVSHKKNSLTNLEYRHPRLESGFAVGSRIVSKKRSSTDNINAWLN